MARTSRKPHTFLSRRDALICRSVALSSGLPQTDVGRQFDVSQATVSRIISRTHHHLAKR